MHSDDCNRTAPETARHNGAGAPGGFFRPKPDGNVDPAGEAGWYLERERERRGLSLQTVSRATGVHPQHLRAIELGMLENLPERQEALRMIASYARFLGFDPQPLVEHYASCIPREESRQAFSSGKVVAFPLMERLRGMARTPGGLSASVLAAMLMFGGLAWSVWPSGGEQQAAPMMAQAPAEQAKPAAADADRRMAAAETPRQPQADPDRPAAASAPEGDGARVAAGRGGDPIAALIARTMPNVVATGKDEGKSAAPRVMASADATAGNGEQQPPARAKAIPLPPPPVEEHVAQPATPAVERAGKQHDENAALARAQDTPLSPEAVRPLQQVPEKGISLRAAEQIWLRLEDDNGTPWYVGFLKRGEVLALPMDKALRLSASDVHRLEWYVNGQRMGRLGKRGADFLSEPLGALYKQSGLKVPGAAG